MVCATQRLSPVKKSNFHGVALFLAALFLFAVSDATAKYLTAFFAVPLLAWARYTIHCLFMLGAVAPGMGLELVRTRRPVLMVFRALTQVASTLFILMSFRTLPLAESTALAFTSPLMVALLAGPLLGERLRLRNWLATLCGFAGVLLIVRPGGDVHGMGVVYALCAALSYAMYQILTRKLASSEPPLRQLFYIALVGMVSMSCLLPFFWTGIVPSFKQGMLILSLGFYGGMGHFLLIRAFHEAPASSLSPMLYVQLVWALLLGWIVFGQAPDALSMAGITVVCLSGLGLVLNRKRKVV
jgi:drug/metabolite transporter (DMT)-like permease